MRGATTTPRPTTRSIAFDAGEMITVERSGHSHAAHPAPSEPTYPGANGYDVPRSGWPTAAADGAATARRSPQPVKGTSPTGVGGVDATSPALAPAGAANGAAPTPGDSDFDQEVVDDVRLLLEEAARTPAVGPTGPSSSASTPMGAASAPAAALGSSARTKIFDDIAASMSHARSYDLGSVALDHRFDEFDREADATPHRPAPASGRPLPPPAPAPSAATLPAPTSVVAPRGDSTTEFVEDLDLITAQTDNSDIPLDPGVGGRSIGESALEAGDVILSTTDHPLSETIRRVTGAEVSHAALYIGDGKVVEAIEGGVKLRSLSTAIADDTLAVAYRHRDMTPVKASQVVAFAEQHARAGTPFDTWGLIQVAPGQLARAICNQKEGAEREACLANVPRLRVGTNDDGAFFCSELVLEAYSSAGLTFVDTDPSWSSPGQIVELHHNGLFDYVGHLIA